MGTTLEAQFQTDPLNTCWDLIGLSSMGMIPPDLSEDKVELFLKWDLIGLSAWTNEANLGLLTGCCYSWPFNALDDTKAVSTKMICVANGTLFPIYSINCLCQVILSCVQLHGTTIERHCTLTSITLTTRCMIVTFWLLFEYNVTSMDHLGTLESAALVTMVTARTPPFWLLVFIKLLKKSRWESISHIVSRM